MMEMDKDLYRKAHAALKRWNEFETIERLQQAKHLTPEQGWKQYISLWELLMKIAPDGSDYQHQEHIKDLEQYYSNVQKLQAWMRLHGEAT